jgi:hypothetical protein
VVSALVAVLAAAAAAPVAGAVAAPKALSGTVSKSGQRYTLIALAANGRAKSIVLRRAFRLVPPAGTVTLHLRDRKGRYAGPVVVGGTRRKVILGVKAGAKLGRIRLLRGFARATPARRFIVSSAWAKARADVPTGKKARAGVPIGARNLGRVKTTVSGKAGRGRDLDHDGVPGAFDVDDDGDLVLDNVDRAPRGAGASASVAAPDDPLHPVWIINSGLQISCIAEQQGLTHGTCGYAVNQNAAGPFASDANFQALINVLMKTRGELLFPIPSGGGAELDCGGLSYCRSGGSGFFHTRSQKFPERFDADRDGFGTMAPVPSFQEGQDGLGVTQTVDPRSVFGLAPLAGAAEVKAGDSYIDRIGTTEQPVTLGSVFGTLPALAAWSDPARNVPISYPVPTGAEGSESNAFTVKAGADGDYRVTLSVWRPQRRAIPDSGEGSGWIDLGGLRYTVVGKTAEQNRHLWRCPPSALTTQDASLTQTAGGLVDSAPDRPVSAANRLTFTVNLSECYRFSNLGQLSTSTTVFVTALSAYGDAAEGVGFSFKPLPPGGVASSAFAGTWHFTGGAPGTGIDWTVQAKEASTSRFGIIVYDPFHVAGGTAPPGWTCSVQRTSRDNDTYLCEGGTLSPGESVSGHLDLDQVGNDGMSVDLLACTAGNVCQGFGMTRQ